MVLVQCNDTAICTCILHKFITVLRQVNILFSALIKKLIFKPLIQIIYNIIIIHEILTGVWK